MASNKPASEFLFTLEASFLAKLPDTRISFYRNGGIRLTATSILSAAALATLKSKFLDGTYEYGVSKDCAILDLQCPTSQIYLTDGDLGYISISQEKAGQ